MTIISNTVGYLDGDTVLEGFFAYDDTIEGQRPTVMINHAWLGRNDFVEDKARKLAKLGYFAFAVDMYGQGILGENKEDSARLMQPFIDDRSLILRRMKASLSALKLMPWVDDKNIATVGYCFGGLCVLDLARSGEDIKGTVSFHGLLFAPKNSKIHHIKSKILILHGHDDPMNSTDQVNTLQQELSQAGADWQLHSYGNTLHAFTNPTANDPEFGTVYHSDADRRSWISMKNFLDEVFS